jgi:transposase InsO family protein
VKTVAQTLNVSRSNLTLRQKGSGKERKTYVKADDAMLLPAVRAIVDERPTYGYRRVGALLNRQRRTQGLPLLNHKKVYRLMSQNGLLLARQPQKRSDRPHNGKVITLRSNLRWASDGFEIPCWNRAVVRVTFVIDTCDREIIAWGATTGGFDGETVRDLMLLCVERRFDSHRTPHAVEWLTDNGSCYTARETIAFGQSLGLVPCFTPVRSPESNGMAESFVKTFKRDYVYVHDRPDAATVLAQLDRWFDDYNESHPHKGLKMKSPREFIRAQLAAGCPI